MDKENKPIQNKVGIDRINIFYKANINKGIIENILNEIVKPTIQMLAQSSNKLTVENIETINELNYRLNILRKEKENIFKKDKN